MSSEPRRQPDPGDPGEEPPGPVRDVAGAAAAAPALSDGEPVTLTDAKGMRALAHPVRLALIDLFTVRETLTATQASDALGESPANCAFHLRTLAKYGFVHEAGGGRGRERPWALTNRTISLDMHQADPQAALAATELGKLWLDRWMDRARRVFSSGNQVPGWDEASGWTSSHVFLTPAETTALRAEMRRMLRRYEERLTDPALRPAGALPVEWSIFASPVPDLSEQDPAAGPSGHGVTGPGTQGPASGPAAGPLGAGAPGDQENAGRD